MLGWNGCTGVFPASESDNPGMGLSDSLPVNGLAGIWEYEEDGGVLYQLAFDQRGQGTYDWQGGTFETSSLSGRRWVGKWHQSGNDREGGFEAHLSEDYHSATGHWWYTRIGKNGEPTQPGGRFTLTRRFPLGCQHDAC
ncbi:MAG: hypothetical protein GKS05_04920 [Nitrospirales bacterium]|nr:hypothetical protein [Nitrospirales bacterium]